MRLPLAGVDEEDMEEVVVAVMGVGKGLLKSSSTDVMVRELHTLMGWFDSRRTGRDSLDGENKTSIVFI